VLLVGLLAAALYAAFARGAIDIPDESRLQVLLAALALGAAAAWLAPGSLRARAPAGAWWGLALLLAFGAWSALSLIWSVAPAQTWVELNRALEYALVVALALAVGSTDRRALNRFTLGWLLVASLVALYAIGGKVAPGLHVNGLFDLNHTAVLSRLRAPLDYWNALSLSMVLAVPIAIVRAADPHCGQRRRLWSLLALALLLTVAALTYSRGGIAALVVAVAVLTFLGGRRLRPVAVLALAALATAPALAYAFSQHALTHDEVSLSSRTGPGLVLGLILALSLAGLWLAGRRLIALEAVTRWTPERSRRAWRGVALAVSAVIVVAAVAAASSSRGLGGTISHQVSSFKAVKRDNVSDPNRLLSTNSGNRWVWWKEAAGAFSARPLQGWGAGSFVVTHLLYRKPPPLPVLQPHNLPLQLLAEDGLVGALLAYGGLLALLAAALARVRALAAAGPEHARDHMLAVACVAAAVAWLVHGLIDWDWDIPGVTIPALALLGVAAAMPGVRDTVPTFSASRRPAAMMVALAAVTIALCAFAASAILPAWSQSKARNALDLAAGHSDPSSLARAADQADIAARLNPLATEPLVDASTIAADRGLTGQARRYLLEAVDRAPYDASVWDRLALLAINLGDRAGARRAALQALSLDPANGAAAGIAAETVAIAVAPQDSPTATGTPLTEPLSTAPPTATPTPGTTPTTPAPQQLIPLRGRRVQQVR
jgi:tetratricopeptide (TPR) repeat protein